MKSLENKWLLLDTNIIIEQLLHSSEDFWLDFERQIISLNCTTIITPEIRFELLRNVRSNDEKRRIESFLKKINVTVIDISKSNDGIWRDAEIFGHIYHSNKFHGINAIDCLLASMLKQYPNNLYLATFNNKDFPVKMFDREGMLNFEIENEIKVMGIYCFSEKKYKYLYSKFNKSKAN